MLKSSFLPVVLFIAAFIYLNQRSHQNKSDNFFETVNKHEQIYSMSCIPSSVEMILKYNKKVPANYYELQNAWKDKSDGTFANFNGKTIAGIRFTHRFNLPRNDSFPYDKLYNTIDRELTAGRKVIISLQSGPGLWHMYVIESRKSSGDYMAYSRAYKMADPLMIDNVKQCVKAMKGTDIMTYEVK